MKWNSYDIEHWFNHQLVQRSNLDEVASEIQKLKKNYEVIQYGALSLNPDLYPLFLLKSKNFSAHKKTILVTGGVHGYETSGVQGAIRFLQSVSTKYTEHFNIACAPCLSPWSYETINRWNSKALDPNRNFYFESPAEESRLFLKAMIDHNISPYAHFDLHETTDTDNSIFRPALEQRDGIKQEHWEIPDGFYLVGDSENPQKEFQKAIIESVRAVTHIAPHDPNGKMIGVRIEQDGVINYELKKLFLCAGFSNAEYTTTTEVYPDSPKVTAEICIQAQVAAVTGGLDYLIGLENL